MIEWKQRVQKLRRFDVNPRGFSTWRTHRYFIDFESRIHVEISTSNRCHNFHVDSPFKINVISTNFPRGISPSNRWRIDEYVSIGRLINHLIKQTVMDISYCFTFDFDYVILASASWFCIKIAER